MLHISYESIHDIKLNINSVEFFFSTLLILFLIHYINSFASIHFKSFSSFLFSLFLLFFFITFRFVYILSYIYTQSWYIPLYFCLLFFLLHNKTNKTLNTSRKIKSYYFIHKCILYILPTSLYKYFICLYII